MSIIRPEKQISLEYAKNLASRWSSYEIKASAYYYYKARKCLKCFGDWLSEGEYGHLVSLIEFYNHHR